MHWEDPEGWDGEEGGRGVSGWGTHVNPWLIHVNVWQKPLQYCKVISLQLIKINGKKKAFLSISAKKEENNRMTKTRDLFKKIRDTKGIFHVKMGTIKDRNGMDLTEAEDIKKRYNNTQKNYTKKIFMTQITMVV